ncbi:GNAT family N-acetyltransferase [Microbacterium resistens]|uniref:GNAT family N-acetyltransferase n=1 Tax=Microbacterium resistens TaxID=156977 RepID=UPI001C58E24F|nr:GNAT family N-acetyltransferase [Microbacterium resistens]MBW1637940.1 GNAT family N-acetyltransferase [Microbacterium resistens]
MTIDATTPTLEIAPLVVPSSIDAADAAEFLAYAELNRRICAQDAGRAELAPSAAEMLPEWHDTTDVLPLGFVARRDDEIVGFLTVYLAQEDGATAAEFDLLVAPEHWDSGAPEALLRKAGEEAVRHGRTALQTWTLHRPDAGAVEVLTPLTGWGRVTRTPLASLLEQDGYALEQVERNSEFDLRADPSALRERLDEALAFAGEDYRVRHWTSPTPPELRERYAAILSRLSTDAPSGGLHVDEESWDAGRVERREAQFAEAGQLVSVVAVEHVPSGDLVAYNELVIAGDRTGMTHQYGTLVHADHRGHLLGTIVKCENLLRWRELAPHSPTVSTFNAEENRPMLSINEAIGFTAVSFAAAWQKRLDS